MGVFGRLENGGDGCFEEERILSSYGGEDDGRHKG